MHYSTRNLSIHHFIGGVCFALLCCGCPKDETVVPEPDANTTAPIIDVVQDKSRWLAISDFRVKNQLRNEGNIQYYVSPYLVSNVGYENGVFKQIGMVNTVKVNYTTGEYFQNDTVYHELTFSKNGSSRSSKIVTIPRCDFAKYRENTHILDYYKPCTIVGVYTAAFQNFGDNKFYPKIVGDETYITGGNILGGSTVGSNVWVNLKHKNEGDTLYRLQDPEGVQLAMPFVMADKQLYCLIKKYHTLMLRTRIPAFNGSYTLEAGTNDRYFFGADLESIARPYHVHRVSADGKKCFFWVNTFVDGRTWGFEFDLITQVMTLKTKLLLQPSEFVQNGVMDENGDYYYVSAVGNQNTVRKITMGLPNGAGSIAYSSNIAMPDVTIKVIGKADGKLLLQAHAGNSQTIQHSIIIEK